jgi:peroxin-7
VEFSPFYEQRIAIATSQYFGIIGNGRQYILDMQPDGQMYPVRYFDTQDGLYDCTWNEANENQIAGASADGSVKLWDLNSSDPFPIANYHEHEQEVSSVDWNIVSKDLFVTASWDKTIKVPFLS